MNTENLELKFSLEEGSLIFNEEQKTISGIFAPYGEIAEDRNAFIQSGGLSYPQEIPVFLGHWADPENMVGIATVLEDDSKSLRGEVVFLSSYKYTENVIVMIRSGNFNGFSVGLKDTETKTEKGKPTIVTKGYVKEVSIVRYPALEGATIKASKKEVQEMEKLSTAEWEDMAEHKKLEVLENIFSTKLSQQFLSLLKETQNLYKVVDVYKKLENLKGVN